MAPPGPAVDEVRAEPVCLALDGGDVLVMLQRPEPDGARGTALLLCPPFGWQEVCSYRGLRAWSLALAHAGYPAARLTLPSTGDSAGGPRDPGRLQAWTDAVSGAAGWLREATGAVRLVAVGIGLGGMVACRAAADGAPIDDLVLWAVPARGRALVREMHSYHRMIAATFPDDAREGPGSDGELELIGYVLSGETAGALGDLNLTSLEFPGGERRRVLMLARDGIAPDAKLAEHLRADGAAIESADGGDYAELMANPQQSVAPGRTIALTLDWLRRGPDPAPAQPAPPAQPALRHDWLSCSHDGVRLRETPLWLNGVRGRIFAVLTEPVDREPLPVCSVLLGAGALAHSGPNRSWVDLTRGWAARGVPSLRVDLAGVGEADGDDADPDLIEDPSFYDPWRDGEVLAILDQLQRRGVADHFVLGGLCSGAYRALRRALVDPRVCGLLLINLYGFLWSHELVAERGRRDSIASGLPNARGRQLDREFVSKAMHYARPDNAWRLLRRSAEREQKREAITALDRLRETGTETLLLLAEREPLLTQFERQGIVDQVARWPNLTLERCPSADHMFRALWLQEHVYAVLDAAVDRAVASTGAGAPSTAR